MSDIGDFVEECTCDEHRLFYERDESLYLTPENNVTIVCNYTGIRLKDREGWRDGQYRMKASRHYRLPLME